VIFLGDGRERFSRLYTMPARQLTHLSGWNVSDLRGKFVGRALRQVQFKRGIVGSREAQQRGI